MKKIDREVIKAVRKHYAAQGVISRKELIAAIQTGKKIDGSPVVDWDFKKEYNFRQQYLIGGKVK